MTKQKCSYAFSAAAGQIGVSGLFLVTATSTDEATIQCRYHFHEAAPFHTVAAAGSFRRLSSRSFRMNVHFEVVTPNADRGPHAIFGE